MIEETIGRFGAQELELPLAGYTTALRSVIRSAHVLGIKTPRTTRTVSYEPKPERLTISKKDSITSYNTEKPEEAIYRAKLFDATWGPFSSYTTEIKVSSDRANENWYGEYTVPAIGELDMTSLGLSAMNDRLKFFEKHANASNVSHRARKDLLTLVHEIQPLLANTKHQPDRYAVDKGAGFQVQIGPQSNMLLKIEWGMENEHSGQVWLHLLRLRPQAQGHAEEQPYDFSQYESINTVSIEVEPKSVTTELTDDRRKVFADGLGRTEHTLVVTDNGKQTPKLSTWIKHEAAKPIPSKVPAQSIAIDW